MSAKTLSNTYMLELGATGILRPLQAMQVNRPIVLSVTVLPPVFGPVITKVLKFCPKETEIGTAIS